MPSFLIPLHEFNQCHNPSGEDGGQFCSAPGAATEEDDYRGQHGAPGRDGGAPLSDLTGEGKVYPDDIYSANAVQYYGTSEPTDRATYATILKFKGRPDAKVTVYRAVPLDVAGEIEHLEKRQREIMRRGSDDPKEYDNNYKELEQLRKKPPGKPMTINPGDWVTINRRYAKDHGESALQGRYTILSKSVRVGDVFTNGDSWHEWGWDPEKKK